MKYFEGPWQTKEIEPKSLYTTAKHLIQDPVGHTIATLKASYIQNPDAPAIEDCLNIWRNTARLISLAPDMYQFINEIAEYDYSIDQPYIEDFALFIEQAKQIVIRLNGILNIPDPLME